MDIRNILDIPWLYLLWQRPFIVQKIEPFLKKRHDCFGKLLDLGCGPGTSRSYIPVLDYTGIDLNAGYISDAENKLSGDFLVGDASKFSINKKFDTILCNSLSHHLSNEQIHGMLDCCVNHLAPDGELHLIDVIMPPRSGIPRFLAKQDRGLFVRSHEELVKLVSQKFEPYNIERFSLHLGGVNLWHMIYISAKAL